MEDEFTRIENESNGTGSGKRRGRPRKNGTSGGTGTGTGTETGTAASQEADVLLIDKPKRKRRQKASDLTNDSVSNLCVMGFAVLAMARGDHWQKDKSDIDNTIAEPLTNILNRYGLGDKIGASSDFMALAVGLFALCSSSLLIEYETIKRQFNSKQGQAKNSYRNGFASTRSENRNTAEAIPLFLD